MTATIPTPFSDDILVEARSKKESMHTIGRKVLIGAALTNLALASNLPSQPTISKSPDAGNAAQASKHDLQHGPIKFEVASAGEVLDEQGVHLSVTSYKASDGVSLQVLQSEFVSAVAAHDYFEKVLVKAATVLKRGKKNDKSGRVIGERAEVKTMAEPNNGVFTVVFTIGPHFYEILSQSSSFRDARRLEKLLTN